MVEAAITVSKETNQGGFTLNEVQAAQEVLYSLVKAVKNYALFPENHSTSIKFRAAIKERLDIFLKKFDFLRFDISKDTFLYNGSPINKGNQETEDLALQLYRDGVQWVEFEKGIELREISLFLKTINTYKNISQEDAEDDLVTALWSADLVHIHYEATDIFWDGEPLLDFAELNKTDQKATAAESVKRAGGEEALSSSEKGEKSKHPGGKAQDKAQSLQSPVQIQDVDPGLYSISAEEDTILKRMVEQEEANDGKHDALDVLLIVLSGEQDKHNFLRDLDFFKEEFGNVLSAREFEFALALLRKMYALFHESKSDKPWTIPILEDFFREISGPKILNVLFPVLSVLDELDKTQVKLLAKFLVSLHPQAIKPLGLMVPQIASSRVQRLLLDIISYMANRDIEPLVGLLDHPDENFVLKVVHVLSRINNQRSSGLLIDKMVHHTSDKVRRESLKILISRDTQELTKLFHLVSDSSNSVRLQILRYLGRRKSTNAEDLLLRHIKDLQQNYKDEEHIVNCYKALGGCGSNRSLLFLRRVLLNRPWNWFYGFGASRHRRGAALALASLGTEDSMGALLNASNSMFPHVRAAYRDAIGE
jgi:HEAT repeat protein